MNYNFDRQIEDVCVFIDLLKVFAAICITNSHFSNVWSISGIASGGMLGDVLFFAVSGYCLKRPGFRVKSFGKWYGKRIKRVYITVWIVGILSCFLTEVSLEWRNLLRIFIYPTQYHFIASIMILYIVYYFVMWVLERWCANFGLSVCRFRMNRSVNFGLPV